MNKEVKLKRGTSAGRAGGLKSVGKELFVNRYLYLMALPGIIFYIIFCYIPMYNILIAFQDYNPVLGVLGSPWVGFKHFERLFDSIFFWRVIKNTVGLSTYAIVASFWIPIVFALLLNELRSKMFKKLVQTLTYIPHFVSLVVLCGMVTSFCMKDGLINDIIAFFGGERSNLLMRPELFKTIYVVSGIWSSMGWGSIVYVAALSGIDPTLYEAAEIDGAKRLRQAIHITLPGILPTIVTMLLLNIGTIMSVGFEKVFLLQNTLNKQAASVISTYVYEVGLINSDYGYSTAIGLFNSIINMILLVGANWFCKKFADESLF